MTIQQNKKFSVENVVYVSNDVWGPKQPQPKSETVSAVAMTSLCYYNPFIQYGEFSCTYIGEIVAMQLVHCNDKF